MTLSSAEQAGPALSTAGLSKRFGERIAFDDVTFEVGRGEVFGFLGPNGAGKTTTVRTLATLVRPTAGSATVAGLPLTPENEVDIRRRIAVMPESPGLYLRLSVEENLTCFARLYELTQPKPRIQQALQAVNLVERRRDPCGSLSKGLRQRVSLARALLSDPEILFLDEPTSGLDPVAARDVHEPIDGLRRRGVTIFLTTHRLDEAERLCDRVAILNTTLRSTGRPDELRDQLFARTLTVRTLAPLPDPDCVLDGLAGVETWREDDSTTYVLVVSNLAVAAPATVRALVAADADVLSVSESRHSLQDVYLELVDEDVEGAAAMNISWTRVRAIASKELTEYRRSGSIISTMAVVPLVFILPPMIEIFTTSAAGLASGDRLVYMLGIPAIVPAVIAAYAVVGERQQGTLEPVLTTPIRREELLLGKAIAALAPSLAISYLVYGLALAVVEIFAKPGAATAVLKGGEILAQVIFTPLVAGWAIWAGMAISTRTRDVRVSQQLGTLVSLPVFAIAALIAFGAIHASLGLALGLGAALVVLDVVGWRITSALFDRERLITGNK